MKKYFLLALGCSLAFTMTACSDSDEEVAEDACWHMLECEMPFYFEARCNALHEANANEKSAAKDQRTKECKKAQRELDECQRDASCTALKKGTVCLTEAANVIDQCVVEML